MQVMAMMYVCLYVCMFVGVSSWIAGMEIMANQLYIMVER